MSLPAFSANVVDFNNTVADAATYAETVPVPFHVVKGRGRPSTYRPEVLAMICGLIRESGMSERQAGGLVGVARSTLSRWRTDDEEIALALDKARAEYLREMMVRVREATTRDGRPEWRAAAWLLQKLCPEEFGTPTQRERARLAREREEQEELHREDAKTRRGTEVRGAADREMCPEIPAEVHTEARRDTEAEADLSVSSLAQPSVSSVPPCEEAFRRKCPENRGALEVDARDRQGREGEVELRELVRAQVELGHEEQERVSHP